MPANTFAVIHHLKLYRTLARSTIHFDPSHFSKLSVNSPVPAPGFLFLPPASDFAVPPLNPPVFGIFRPPSPSFGISNLIRVKS